jgi:acyl-CoA reductase-like NAD-dependent aldehyde dehydrogenase
MLNTMSPGIVIFVLWANVILICYWSTLVREHFHKIEPKDIDELQLHCLEEVYRSKKVANESIEKFVQKTGRLKVGDPLSDETDKGPLCKCQRFEEIGSQVSHSIKEGAEVLTGGEQIGKKEYFYRSRVLKNVNPKMSIAQEEAFGPVAPIIVAGDEMEAVELANNSEYGLGASVWTRDLNKAERFSSGVRSGIVSVNNVVDSYPRVPFGGVKSGFGRELSRYGILEFVNINSVRFYDQLIKNHYVE